MSIQTKQQIPSEPPFDKKLNLKYYWESMNDQPPPNPIISFHHILLTQCGNTWRVEMEVPLSCIVCAGATYYRVYGMDGYQ